MRVALVLLLLVSSLVLCKSLLRGKSVPDGSKYNFMVAVIVKQVDRKPYVHCIGTFIRNNVILTAGHCLSNYLTETSGAIYSIQYGVDEIDISDENNLGRQIDKDDVYFHPKYTVQPCADFDLALIRLPIDELLSHSAIDLCPELVYYDDTPIIISWINRTPLFGPFKLNYVEVSIEDQKECTSEGKLILKGHHMCISGKDGSRSITGDSGSPLIQPQKMCQLGMLYCLWKYMVFIKVSCFNDWIDEVEQMNIEIKIDHRTQHTEAVKDSIIQELSLDRRRESSTHSTKRTTEIDKTIKEESSKIKDEL